VEASAALPGELRTFARAELLDSIGKSSARVWLASPFLSHPIARELTATSPRGAGKHFLTALVAGSVRVGALSPKALQLLKDDGWEVRSIRNLHAKLSIVDDFWGLVGSGNLTSAGLGSTEKGNVELGVVLNAAQIAAAASIYADWWREAGEVSAEDLAHFTSLPAQQTEKAPETGIGPALEIADPADLDSILGVYEPRQRLWVKANYHRRRPDGREWWHRGWISDWRKASYRKGDLILLYLGAKFGSIDVSVGEVGR
jgi:phosphatidylserine/phosphatidylglycerophosphate/cardiolipin synthase-like enzyme